MSAQGEESLQILGVTQTGCTDGIFGMLVETAGLDEDPYIMRTVVTVGDLVYMNEEAGPYVNQTDVWYVFDLFNYGALPNEGAYPIPEDQVMRVDMTLERPKGDVLDAWTLMVDGCNTGNIFYNGPTTDAPDEMFYVRDIQAVSCAPHEFLMTTESVGLELDEPYAVRTMLTVDGLVYMNERAEPLVGNKTWIWSLYSSFSEGPVDNEGEFPIPPDEQMRIEFTLQNEYYEQFFQWTLVVDGCNTGNVLYDGPTDGADMPSPPLNVTATAQPLQATVSWDVPTYEGTDSIVAYEVLNAEDEIVASTSAAVTSVAVIGLEPGSLQTFQVVANTFGGASISDPSNQVTIQAAQETFSDVPPGAPFYAEINWAIVEGITNGYEDGTFKGPQPVARQATAAFLYRLAGEPDYTPPEEPTFTDVPTDSQFYLQIEWLNATGITTGFPDDTFRPTAGTPRQAMAAFLYRFAGQPPFIPPETPTFPDVSTENDFYTEIEWLVTTGITTGFDDGEFKPTQQVARQAMVTFLYRYTTQFVPTPPIII